MQLYHDWTKSAVFARVCYGRGQTTLGLSGFKDVRLEVGVCLFIQVCPSMQLEQATHTALKERKRWQMVRRTGIEIPSPKEMQILVG